MLVVIRIVVAVVAGVLVTLLMAYVGLVVFVLASMGIPLGSEGRELTAAEYAVLLVVAAAAAVIGARVTSHLGGADRSLALLILAVTLAALYVSGFSDESSRWPSWWAPSVAVVSVFGVWLGGIVRASRHAPWH